MNESVHDYYEWLLRVFRQYSGVDDVDRGDMSNFVSHFVLGLRPEVSMHIQ